MTTTETRPVRKARAPRAGKAHHAAIAAVALEQEIQAVLARMPTTEQLDAEVAACKAEEAAALEAEAAELAAETPPVLDGYNGPMLNLRKRKDSGAYTKMANGQLACGDRVAQALGNLTPAQVIRSCLLAMALPSNPYDHLNIGQQSMNLRNKLRGCLKRVDFGFGVVEEAVEDVLAQDDEQDATELTADKAATE